jgi:hypothetical protein
MIVHTGTDAQTTKYIADALHGLELRNTDPLNDSDAITYINGQRKTAVTSGKKPRYVIFERPDFSN